MPLETKPGMTYFPDLSPCSYGGDILRDFEEWVEEDTSTIRMRRYPTRTLPLPVGWLSSGQPFTQGTVSPEFRRRLDVVLEQGYETGTYVGSHNCEFCDASGAPPGDATKKPSTHDVPSEFHNINIPGRHAVYYAPELIAHYIDEHGYRPPDEFMTALIECPPFRSTAYFLALLEAVGPALATALERVIRSPWPHSEWFGEGARVALRRYRGI